MKNYIRTYGYKTRDYRRISCNGDFFSESVYVDVFEDRIEFSKSSCMQDKKKYKPGVMTGYDDKYVLLVKNGRIPYGRFFIEEEDCDDDKVVAYFDNNKTTKPKSERAQRIFDDENYFNHLFTFKGEVWKEIDENEYAKYEKSNFYRIRNEKTGQIIKPRLGVMAYSYAVKLYRNDGTTKYVSMNELFDDFYVNEYLIETKNHEFIWNAF